MVLQCLVSKNQMEAVMDLNQWPSMFRTCSTVRCLDGLLGMGTVEELQTSELRHKDGGR